MNLLRKTWEMTCEIGEAVARKTIQGRKRKYQSLRQSNYWWGCFLSRCLFYIDTLCIQETQELMGLCGQQGFPPSCAHTEIQCRAKSLFSAAGSSFCVRALWHVPWCFLEGSFQLSACWKMNWQSHLQNSHKWRNMSPYLHCQSLENEREREGDKHWQSVTEQGRCGASGYLFTFYPGGHARWSLQRICVNSTLCEWHHVQIPLQVTSSTRWESMIRPSICQCVSQHEAKRLWLITLTGPGIRQEQIGACFWSKCFFSDAQFQSSRGLGDFDETNKWK